MMKVLHVITTINPGGAENHLHDLVRHQAAHGMSPEVAYLRNERRDMGVPTHDLALRFYGDPAPVLKLRRVLKTGDFDLVHAHLPPGELYARLALLGKSLPLLVTKHNDEPFHRGPGERAMGRWVARRASAVIAISRAVKRYMTGSALGLDPGKIHTIHYGIDVRLFDGASDASATRRRWGVPGDALLIGFAGRFVAQKSIGTLLEAFAAFGNREAWLALVGEGPLEEGLRRRAADLGVADRVVWPGFQSDVPAMMRAFDVFAITSVHEGFGLVIAEAMASARPVVATNVSAIPEVVADGETGLLVPPGDPAAVCAALEKLADPALRERMGQAGRKRVASEFTLVAMFGRTDALYARLLSQKAGNTRENAAMQPA